ncbi:hypothetical protein C8J57DRAFT_1299046 [Mycena rebaudengoi]|nr:hypothetical protein C8J57DRAFT_1299046 [Mycena rebaudengoi]
MSVQPAVIWDKRGIRNHGLIPASIDSFVRTQIREQFPSGTTYTPVSWDEIQTTVQNPGTPSVTLYDAPFICAITFIRIANPVTAQLATGSNGQPPKAVIFLKEANTAVQLTPGYTQTPCTMVQAASSAPPDIFEGATRHVSAATLQDPTKQIVLLNEGIEIEYMLSYWRKTA